MTDQADQAKAQLKKAALDYHRYPRPGKIAVTPIKQMVNQNDLALADRKSVV